MFKLNSVQKLVVGKARQPIFGNVLVKINWRSLAEPQSFIKIGFDSAKVLS